MILNIWLEAWEHHRGFLKAGLGLINLHAPQPLTFRGASGEKHLQVFRQSISRADVEQHCGHPPMTMRAVSKWRESNSDISLQRTNHWVSLVHKAL